MCNKINLSSFNPDHFFYNMWSDIFAHTVTGEKDHAGAKGERLMGLSPSEKSSIFSRIKAAEAANAEIDAKQAADIADIRESFKALAERVNQLETRLAPPVERGPEPPEKPSKAKK